MALPAERTRTTGFPTAVIVSSSSSCKPGRLRPSLSPLAYSFPASPSSPSTVASSPRHRTTTSACSAAMTASLKRSLSLNRSPSSRQLKKYKFFLPVEIYLLAVFMQLASKFHVFPLALKFQDSFASVYCCSNLYNLRSFLREYLYQ